MKLHKYILFIFTIFLFTSCSTKQLELEDINSEVTLQDMAYILEDYVNKVDENTKTNKANQDEIASLKQQLSTNKYDISTNAKEIDILKIKVKNLKQETKDSIINYIKSHNILNDNVRLSPKTITLSTINSDTNNVDNNNILEEFVSNETPLSKPILNSKIPKKSTKYKLARVYVPQGVVVKNIAKREAQTIKHYKQNTILKIKRCDRFGWCKLYGERGYVTHFLLNFQRLKP
jgi:hypothetical protein